MPAFIERFSRFANSRFNGKPGANAAEDASYYAVKHVLEQKAPWEQVFNGSYRIDNVNNQIAVVADTGGLGYFRSAAWMARYAGNEGEGYRIAAAYRMINNVLGVQLVAAVNTMGVDAAGRKAAPCGSCHYNATYGLDNISKILSRKDTANAGQYLPPSEGAQLVLGSKMIDNDRDFINAMVKTVDFRFNACRLAVQFLYSRDEYSCEGSVFDACMTAFQNSGQIQTAIATIAKHPSFCR